MKLKCPIDALPQIQVANWNQLAKPLPSPLPLPPLANAAADSSADVLAASDQCDVRGLFESLESADDGQQLQSIAVSVWFRIGGDEELIASD
jgi:hypothetical protein